MLANLEYELIGFIVAVALLEGGRRERLVALVAAIHFILYVIAMTATVAQAQTYAMTDAVEIATLPVLVWLAFRHRLPWLTTLALLQGIDVAVWIATTLQDALQALPYRLAFFGLDLLKAACLLRAVTGRMWSAPTPPPDAGRADPDLLAVARESWPGRALVARQYPVRSLRRRHGVTATAT